MDEVLNKFKPKLECAVDGAPSQIPTLVANVANSMTDYVTDGRTDGKTELLSHTLTMRGDHEARLVKFRTVVQEEIARRTSTVVQEEIARRTTIWTNIYIFFS